MKAENRAEGRPLTERQQSVLDAVERLGRPAISDLRPSFPELSASTVVRVLDALARKGLVESSGVADDVYMDGVRWQLTPGSRGLPLLPRAPGPPPKPPPSYFAAVARLACTAEDLVKRFGRFGEELWPALLASRVGFVGAVVCDVDQERQAGACLPMEAEWSNGESIREVLSEALFDATCVGAHLAATMRATIGESTYGEAVETVAQESVGVCYGLSSHGSPKSLKDEVAEIQILTGRLVRSIRDIAFARTGASIGRVETEDRAASGERPQKRLVAEAVELIARTLALMSLIEAPDASAEGPPS